MSALRSVASVIKSAKPLASLGISMAASYAVEEFLVAWAPQLADTFAKQLAFRVGVFGVGVATSQIVAEAIEKECDDLRESLEGLDTMMLEAKMAKEANDGGAAN